MQPFLSFFLARDRCLGRKKQAVFLNDDKIGFFSLSPRWLSLSLCLGCLTRSLTLFLSLTHTHAHTHTHTRACMDLGKKNMRSRRMHRLLLVVIEVLPSKYDISSTRSRSTGDLSQLSTRHLDNHLSLTRLNTYMRCPLSLQLDGPRQVRLLRGREEVTTGPKFKRQV